MRYWYKKIDPRWQRYKTEYTGKGGKNLDVKQEIINIRIYDHRIQQIIERPMDEIIREMVAAQIPITFEIEALKAQAIIARTSIVRKARVFGGEGCCKFDGADFCNCDCGKWIPKEEWQDIWGSDFEANWNKLDHAVRETKDSILTIHNKPIEPKVHSTCGGATENSESVEEHKVIYLRKVLCDYCRNSPEWREVKEITLEELEEKLNITTGDLSPFREVPMTGIFDSIERDDAGRIVSLKIAGKKFAGKEIMRLLGLNSTRFGWKPTVFQFETQGTGHGLGLCQYGSNQMAIEGKKAEEILNYYFTGIQIKEFEQPSINKPLRGKIFVVDPGHGGDNEEDVRGPTGLREKDVNLSIALKIADLLEKAGAEVYTTRAEDIYVPLGKRASLANSVRPNFFLSIHQNYFANPNISGSEIYHYRGDQDGEELAVQILRELSQGLGTADRGVKVADFFLLREVRTSALQIEVAYITNPEEEEKLKGEEFHNKAAEAIVKGLIRYYTYQ